MNKDHSYIGVFDSGIGGLTAVRELQRRLPSIPIVYLGDTARLPYGTKSDATIIRYVREGVNYLLSHYRLTALLIACNTASAIAAEYLRQQLTIPIFDVIDPAALLAVQQTVTKTVLITGTHATIESRSYEQRIAYYDSTVKTISVPCPLFVPLAEEGLLDHPLSVQAAQLYLQPFQSSKADTLILGCTHFPLLLSAIRKVVPHLTIINSGAAAAAALANTIPVSQPAAQNGRTLHIILTDLPRQFPAIAERFLGYPIDSLTVVPDLTADVPNVV